MYKLGYFNYLLDMVGIEYNGHTYVHLLEDLYSIDFRWSIHNDDNRAYDGIDIRYNYVQDCGVSERSLEELSLIPCTVMEVICGLAIRMDGIMRDPERSNIGYWFWELIKNLGLLGITDERYESGERSLTDIKNSVDIFMDRTYDELGHGGLFPRNYCDRDQRNVELFEQMNGYLYEFYC